MFRKVHDVEIPPLQDGATIKLKKKGNICILKLSGKLNLYNIYQVEFFFNQLVEKGNKSIILDLKKVNYLDSSGLGGLLKMSTDIKKYNGNMSICRLQDYPKNLVKMACLEYTLLVSSSVRESIKKLKQAS